MQSCLVVEVLATINGVKIEVFVVFVVFVECLSSLTILSIRTSREKMNDTKTTMHMSIGGHCIP